MSLHILQMSRVGSSINDPIASSPQNMQDSRFTDCRYADPDSNESSV
jgi:hypothetical protein